MSSNSGDTYKYRIGILTASDSCSENRAQDTSGDRLVEAVSEGKLGLPSQIVAKAIVPDDVSQIKAKLIEWCDEGEIDLVITTGGTGFSPRDVTPEATKAVIEKEAPGLALCMLMKSLQVTPLAMLSRSTCGIRGKTLIINLPGSKKASQECLSFVLPALPHALQLLHGDFGSVSKTHAELQQLPASTQSSASSQQVHHGHHLGPHHSLHHKHHRDHHDATMYPGDLPEGMASRVTPVAKRHRHSPYPLISVEKALEIVLNETEVVISTEVITYKDALGRILANDVFAVDPLPAFPASIKDGYAVIASDGAGVRTVVELSSSAGSQLPRTSLLPGTCMRINTGAPLPPGSDAVVQVEDTELVKASDDGCIELEVNILCCPTAGLDVRPVGSDIAAGERVLERGSRLCSPEVGVLAAVGATHVTCFSLPKIGIMSTGNELVEPGMPLPEGKVRDSNRIAIINTLHENGFPNVQDLGIVRDSLDSLSAMVLKGLQDCDIIVTTGGASMGDMDFIKPVLERELGATIHFARVMMKPGKPTTFATVFMNGQKKLIFALPGNPVSALVTCHLYVLPALRKMSSMKNFTAPVLKVKAEEQLELDTRPEYRRASLSWADDDSPVPTASVRGRQDSSRLPSLCSADVLLILPPRTQETAAIAAGELVKAMFLRRMM